MDAKAKAIYELRRFKEAIDARPDWEKLWSEERARTEALEAKLSRAKEALKRAETTMALSTESALRKDKRGDKPDSFQHRHYAALASIIRGLGAQLGAEDQKIVAWAFARRLESNSNFDLPRFIRACE